MQNPVYGLPGTPLLGTWVNRHREEPDFYTRLCVKAVPWLMTTYAMVVLILLAARVKADPTVAVLVAICARRCTG